MKKKKGDIVFWGGGGGEIRCLYAATPGNSDVFSSSQHSNYEPL